MPSWKAWEAGESFELPLEDVVIRGRRGGQEGRARVLLLHGWLDNGASFWRLVEALPAGIRWVAPDLGGHGRSGHVSRPYHFIDWVGMVRELVDGLGWDDLMVVGHSMGGAIASLYAGVDRERVQAVGLIDALGPWSDKEEAAVERLRKALTQEEQLRQSGRGSYEDLTSLIAAMARSRGGIAEEAVAPMALRAARRRGDGRWEYGHDRLLQAASRVRLTAGQVRAFLKAIEAPVWLVRPDGGWPVDEDLMAGRLDAVEHLTQRRLEGGHHIHLEKPAEVVEALGGLWR